MSIFEHIKSVYKDASILGVAVILQQSIGFIMLPIYAHYLRGEGYGIVGMLGIMTSMMTLIIGFGMKGGIQRYYFLEESDLDKKKTVSTGILVILILSIFISIPVLFGSKFVSWLLFGKADFSLYVVLASIAFIADMTSHGGEAYVFISKETYFFSLLTLTRTILNFGLNIYLVVYRQMGVLGFLYSNLVAAIIFSFIINLKSLLKVGFHFEWRAAKNILKYNLPMVPGFIANFIRNNADKIILRSFLGIESLGVYMMLIKLTSLISVLITGPFMRIWSVKRLEICDQENGSQIIAKVFNLQTSLILFIGLVLALEIPYILMVLTPEEFWLGSFYALLAVLPQIMISSFYHFCFGIIYSKLTFNFSKIYFITALISCIANYLFIKELGLLGALIASCIVYSVQMVIAHLFSRKHYFIPFAWSKLSSMFIGFIILFFLIDAISIKHFEFINYIGLKAKPVLISWLKLSHLDAYKIGGKLTYMINNLEITLDAILKCGFSFSFIFLLYFIGIVPKKRLGEIITVGLRKKRLDSLSK